MKKLYTTLILSIFVIALISAGTIGYVELSKTIPIGTEYKTTIDAITDKVIDDNGEITEIQKRIQRGDINCVGNICEQSMWKGEYKLGTEKINRYKCAEYKTIIIDDETTKECINQIELTLTEQKKLFSIKQEKRLKNIAQTIEERKNKAIPTITKDKGEIVLTTVVEIIKK